MPKYLLQSVLVKDREKKHADIFDIKENNLH